MTEIRNIDGVSVFITQVAAVSCAETQTPEMMLAIQSLRKTGFLSAVQREVSLISSPAFSRTRKLHIFHQYE